MKSLLLRISLLLLLEHITLLGNAQLVLKRVAVNGKTRVSSDKTIQMKPAEDDLFLEFSSVTGDSVLYQYRLIGSEQEWTESAYPAARYQGMKGGSYSFQLKALSKGREIDKTEVSIFKEKAFWNEVWFVPAMLVYVLILVGVGIYLFLLYDFRQKLRMQHVRNQIAADLHDEVGSNLNSIAIFVEVLRKNAPKEMLPILEKIIANSKESVVLMQDTVWTINPKNDSIHKLFDRMNSFAAQLLASRDISFDFQIKADLKKASFTMEQRKTVYLIFKEAINNIVKHAGATKVNVQVIWLKDTLNILIEDNGIGFDISGTFDGNGLVNFKDRAREADIGLLIESVIEEGTRITMLV